jgi:hypothetical protein
MHPVFHFIILIDSILWGFSLVLAPSRPLSGSPPSSTEILAEVDSSILLLSP